MESGASGSSSQPIAVTGKIEETLRKHLLARARERCAPIIEDFNKCSEGRTFSVVWACREQFNAMNECLHKFTSDEEFDRLKAHWILQQETKQRLAREKANQNNG